MLLTMLKSKIHMAVLTETVLEYPGSITIPADLIEEARMLPGERVQVANFRNGERLETYIIEGRRGGRNICLNGPAAHKGQPGDRIVIISYCIATEEEAKSLKPVILIMDENNNISGRK